MLIRLGAVLRAIGIDADVMAETVAYPITAIIVAPWSVSPGYRGQSTTDS